MTLFILKNNYSYNHVKKYAYKSENTLITPFHTKNNYIFNHAYPQNSYIFTRPQNIHITPFHTKNNFKRNNPYKKPSHTNNPYEKASHTNHHILTIRMKNHYTNIIRINIFAVINQTNKHKAKIYNQCTHTQIIIQIFCVFSLSYI